MSPRRARATLIGLAALLAALVSGLPSAQAATGPLYDVKATWGDTNLTPGDTSPFTAEGQFAVQVRNIGDEAGAEEDLTIVDELPTGLTATNVYWSTNNDPSEGDLSAAGFCTGAETATVTCELPAELVPALAPAPGAHKSLGSLEPSGYLPTIYIDVSVPAKAKGEGINTATVTGGGVPAPVSDTDQVPFGSAPAAFGLVPGSFVADLFDAAYPLGEAVRQASERPFELRVNFDINAKTGVNNGQDGDSSRYITSSGQLRTFEVTMPRGFLGNPEAIPKCIPADFAELGTTPSSTACPANTQVGYLEAWVANGTHNYGRGGQFSSINGFVNRVPLYNLEPPMGVLADFGFNAGGFVQGHVYGSLDPAQDYAIKTVSPNISNMLTVRGTEATVWGVPGDPAHDKFRYPPGPYEADPAIGTPFGGAPIRPFITAPMDCGFDNGGARARMDSYEHPDEFSPAEEYGSALNVKGCENPRFRFEPDISTQPTSRDAGGPTGLDVHLQAPQRNDEVKDAKDLYAANGNVKAIATPPLKKVVVTFPQGMTVSPSAAQGLASCSAAQIGLGTDAPVRCPDASQYGTLTLRSPALPQDKVIAGRIYIARQSDNPFHNFLSFYLVVEDAELGLRVKLPGKVDLDPQTGQITSTFDDLPQFPVSDTQVTLKGGVRAGLVNPTTCGTKTITAEFFPWQDPTTPHMVRDSYEVTEKADGSDCVNDLAQRPFGPQLEAGTLENTAGAHSSFLLRLTRTDDDQEFSQLDLTLPAGLLAKLSGLSRCSDAGIARAQARTGAGEGALEQADPSCPPSSEIGSTQVGVGVGVPLTYVPGKVYLAGPYRGAPLSVVVISPAVVGPFDIGVIAVRTALEVDPVSTRASAATDPFPLIYQGIPVRVRDIRVKLDRPNFILNPTSCAPKQIEAHVTGTGGDLSSTTDDSAADLPQRFQAADCASLAFKPKLSFRLFGATNRGAHPRLKAVVRGRPGDANIAGASVALPRSEFLDQGHIKTVCTRVQFAAAACPPGSVYGHVTAKSPLFDETFSGPIYLRSSSHPLPDLVAALKGPASLPVEVDLAGRVDSVNGGIRNTFEVVPDVPVSWAVFNVQGGKKGLLVNSTNLCARVHRATAKFTGQNGKRLTLRPKMRASCGKSGKRRQAGHRGHRRR